MKFSFRAKIYQTGINWCVDVPLRITKTMKPDKGYIFIQGKINNHDFAKSLVPVKHKPYRLFVNALMMKGGETALGKTANFIIEQTKKEKALNYPIPKLLRIALKEKELTKAFTALSTARKIDILKYFSFLSKEETILKHVEKVVLQLTQGKTNVRIP